MCIGKTVDETFIGNPVLECSVIDKTFSHTVPQFSHLCALGMLKPCINPAARIGENVFQRDTYTSVMQQLH